MKNDQIVQILEILGCAKIRKTAKGINSNCPLFFKHANKSDNHPSFFVYATPPRSGKTSYATCHACNTKGTLTEIVQIVCDFYKKSPNDLLQMIFNFENSQNIDLNNLDLPSFEKYQYTATATHKKKARVDTDSLFYVFPNGIETTIKYKGVVSQDLDFFYDFFIKGLKCGHTYFSSRGISIEQQKKWDLFYTNSLMYKKIKPDKEYYLDYGERAVFIIRDVSQKVAGFSGRALGPEYTSKGEYNGMFKMVLSGTPKYVHSEGFKKIFYLYGESKWNERPSETIVLCEGFFDAIKIYEATDFNVGAFMGSSLDDNQIKKILGRFKKVIFFPDNDQAGLNAKEVAKSRLADKISFAEVDTNKYPHNLKDAGDMSLDQIRMILSI